MLATVADTTPVREFVLRRISEGLSLGGREFSGTAWWLVLGAILTVGFVYVVWMYVRDGHSIGWFWGTFLALLRLGVYVILAAVFLLPAWQNWEETRQQSEVVVGFDVTGSMFSKDDVPNADNKWEDLPTRQDKVLAFLGDPAASGNFFKRLQEKNPVKVYRFGRTADENYLAVKDGLAWERKVWEKNALATSASPPTPGDDFTHERLTDFLNPALREPPAGAAPREKTVFEDRLRRESERFERLEAGERDAEEVKKAFEERQRKLLDLFRRTNVGESALAVLSKELNNMPQGIVLFSDCRSNEGGPQAYKDLADRARRAKVPVFVVVVGEDRQPTRIEIADARGPDFTRPEDPFKISVDVTGEGLPERDIDVFIDVYKPKDDGKPATPGKDTPSKTLEKRVTLKGGQMPRAQAEFPITPADFGDIPADKPDKPDKPEGKPGEKPEGKPGEKPEAKSTKPELTPGEWLFVPRVPKDAAEIFPKKEHTRDPVSVKVVKRPLRVLLFASAPTRDYQFIRTMMVREFDKKRIELSIYLQPLPGQVKRTGIVQDVPPDRMLTSFPDKLTKESADLPLYNLANYDVIIAFDPDWSELSKEQVELVERWVSQQGGGLVVVAGPIHTLELARPGAAGIKNPGATDAAKLKPILDLYPVVLKDVRLEKERNTAIPAALAFPNANPEMEFLKLDEENEKSTSLIDAWKEFFRGKAGENAGDRVLRGFYGYYPVQKAKDNAIVVATFKDDTSTDKEAPYLVITPTYGRGRVVWLGSGETWRLRQYREVWHERFWTKLARYASAGSMGQSSRRIIGLVGSQFPAGTVIEAEAQFFGKDLKPLREGAQPKPKVILRPPSGVTEKDVALEYEMSPKQVPPGSDWEGRFTARFLIKTPGEYGLDFSLQESGEPASSHKIKVFESDPETSNTRPDLAAAYELASDADDVLARVDDATRAQLKTALQRFKPTDRAAERAAGGEKDKLRLVFDLRGAALIPDCMQRREDTRQNRGKVDDIWDQGLPLASVLYWFAVAMGVLAGGLGLFALILFASGKSPTGTLIGTGMIALLAVAAVGGWLYLRGSPAITFSVVLGLIVGLLSIEWLTRKLLRLA